MSTRKSPERGRPVSPMQIEIPRSLFQAAMTGLRHHLIVDRAPRAGYEVGEVLHLVPAGHEDGVPYLAVRVTAIDELLALEYVSLDEPPLEKPIAVISFTIGLGWGRRVSAEPRVVYLDSRGEAEA